MTPSVITITVNTPPDAGKDSSVSVCRSVTSYNLLSHLGGTPAGGGTWTDVNGSGAELNGIFNPSMVAVSTYSFKYTLANSPPCSAATATIAVTVTDSSNAGKDNTGTVCNTNNAVVLQNYLVNAQTGGQWKDISKTGALTGGVFDATKVTSGSYTFHYVIINALCGNDSSVITITVTPPDAGKDSSVSVTRSATSYNLLSHLGGTPAGGGTWTDVNGTGQLTGNIFNPSKVPAGSYNFTYTITQSPCTGVSSTVTVTVIKTANAGPDTSDQVCKTTTSLNLSGYLRNQDIGGT